jgi:sugar/nucleoside kinase (ribokinase family)
MSDQKLDEKVPFRSGVVGVGDYALDGLIRVDEEKPAIWGNREEHDRAGGGVYNALYAYAGTRTHPEGGNGLIPSDFPARIISAIGGDANGTPDEYGRKLKNHGASDVVLGVNEWVVTVPGFPTARVVFTLTTKGHEIARDVNTDVIDQLPPTYVSEVIGKDAEKYGTAIFGGMHAEALATGISGAYENTMGVFYIGTGLMDGQRRLPRRHRLLPPETLRKVDVMVVNALEAAYLLDPERYADGKTPVEPLHRGDGLRAVRQLQQRTGAKAALITFGGEGYVLFAEGWDEPLGFSALEIGRLRGSVGAGDSLTGGLASYLNAANEQELRRHLDDPAHFPEESLWTPGEGFVSPRQRDLLLNAAEFGNGNAAMVVRIGWNRENLYEKEPVLRVNRELRSQGRRFRPLKMRGAPLMGNSGALLVTPLVIDEAGRVTGHEALLAYLDSRPLGEQRPSTYVVGALGEGEADDFAGERARRLLQRQLGQQSTKYIAPIERSDRFDGEFDRVPEMDERPPVLPGSPQTYHEPIVKVRPIEHWYPQTKSGKDPVDELAAEIGVVLTSDSMDMTRLRFAFNAARRTGCAVVHSVEAEFDGRLPWQFTHVDPDPNRYDFLFPQMLDRIDVLVLNEDGLRQYAHSSITQEERDEARARRKLREGGRFREQVEGPATDFDIDAMIRRASRAQKVDIVVLRNDGRVSIGGSSRPTVGHFGMSFPEAETTHLDSIVGQRALHGAFSSHLQQCLALRPQDVDVEWSDLLEAAEKSVGYVRGVMWADAFDVQHEPQKLPVVTTGYGLTG